MLLSLTATWCHACHRMDAETWEDPGVAAAVARATVPVRVDADERPDLYARYHLGGLPTTALLTADGDFIRGGTYLSPPQLFAFLETALADFNSGRRPGLRARRPRERPESLVDEVIARLLRRADREHGGFGEAPKLVEVEALLLLLRRWRGSRDAALERVLRESLDAAVDHLADPRDGGFFRYAAAADWSGPHTEKVAVDQARIAKLLLEAGCALSEPLYVESARQALAHARRRLADADGHVYASVAADPEYYAGARGDDMPAVDRRRFADASAAMVAADLLHAAITGESPAFVAEFRAAALDGAVPHRLDEADGVRGLLRDQSSAIEAAMVEYRMTGDAALLDWARKAADWSVARLWDERAGAFRAALEEPESGVDLPPMFPLIGNGEMALALAGLAAQSGRAEYRGYAERAVEALGAEAVSSPAGSSIALAAQFLQSPPAEVDLTGDPADVRARDLARAAMAALGPSAVVRWKGGPGPSAIACAGDLCLPPVGSAADLLESLVGVGLAPGGILGHYFPSAQKP